jgi:hypothetical protein
LVHASILPRAQTKSIPGENVFFRESLTIRTIKNEAAIKFKEEKYANLLVLLQGFVGNTTSGELKRKFFEEFYRSWLYSSDGVTESINRMVLLLMKERGNNPDPKMGKEIIGKIIFEMRKDMMGKTSLRPEDFQYIDVLE